MSARIERIEPDSLLGVFEAELETAKAPSLSALANLRERVTDLTDRAAWVADDRNRKHLLERLGKLAERLR